MAALTSSACTKNPLSSAPTSVTPAAVMPLITASELKELIVKSKKPAVINMWATWCEPCKAEMPEIARFKSSKSGERVSVFFISADTDPDAAVRFMIDLGLQGRGNYRLAENADEFGKVFAPTWSATLPTTFITDAQGALKTFWVGQTTQKQLEEKVTKAVGSTL